jgi:hypothetical protein
LRFSKIIDLKTKMVGADCLGRITLDVVPLRPEKFSNARLMTPSLM